MNYVTVFSFIFLIRQNYFHIEGNRKKKKVSLGWKNTKEVTDNKPTLNKDGFG